MAGSGAPCPELSGLKGCWPVAFAGYQLPAAGLIPANGLDKPNESILMTYARPMFPPRVRGRHVPLYCLSPNQFEALHSLHQLRKEAEDEIERLISFLDMVDGYTLSECEDAIDDEACDTDELEPSLCGLTASSFHAFADGLLDGEEDREDEPSLGWTEAGSIGNDQDRECDLVFA